MHSGRKMVAKKRWQSSGEVVAKRWPKSGGGEAVAKWWPKSGGGKKTVASGGKVVAKKAVAL